LRRLGQVFGLCSDEIALDFATEPQRGAPLQTRADRRIAEPVPGDDRHGHVRTRGAADEAQRETGSL
jgi:hypothetical protein